MIDELAADDVLVHYPMHGPRKGRDDVRAFMAEFREAFPDLNFWDGGGTHTGPAFSDLPIGSLDEANTGKTIRFTGTTWFRLRDGKIVEELGQEGALDAVRQLGLIRAA